MAVITLSFDINEFIQTEIPKYLTSCGKLIIRKIWVGIVYRTQLLKCWTPFVIWRFTFFGYWPQAFRKFHPKIKYMYRSSSENTQFSWLLRRSCLLNDTTTTKMYSVEFLSIENLSIVTLQHGMIVKGQ